MPDKKLPERGNYLRRKIRRERAAAILDGRIKKETICPKCGYFFSLQFLLRASAFSETEKKMMGKQIVCPNCRVPLWYNVDGKIEAAVVEPPPKVEMRPLRRVRGRGCIFICRLIRRIKRLLPPPTD